MLSKVLTDYSAMMGFPGSKTMERILEILFENSEEQKIAEALPGTFEEIVSKTGFSREMAGSVINELKKKGAIGQKMNETGQYRLFPAMIELRDSTVVNPDAPQELFVLWDRIITQEFAALIPVAKGLNLPAVTRVLPVEKSVKAQNTVLDVDSARKIFENADLISVVPCACRLQADRVGKRDPDCPAPAESVCMQTNKFAEAVLGRNLGRKIDKAEALRLLSAAEEAGLVHMVRNNVSKDMFMCNCCSCCCVGLHNIIHQYKWIDGIARSRFRVKFDEDACTGCGLCAEKCQFRAIEVGDAAVINMDLCYGCGNCVMACPEGALALEEVRPLDHIRVKK